MGYVVEWKNLSDLYDTALIRIGNYLPINEIKTTEFSFQTFVNLFKNQIYPLLSKYVYKREYRNIYVTYTGAYVFPDPAPEMITRVVPVSVYGLYVGELMDFRFLSHISYLSTKPLSRFMMTWRYVKPKLWCRYQGMVEVEALYKLQFNENSLKVEVDSDAMDVLQDLCSAYAMIAIGRSRRAVRIGDSNLEFDAEGMVAEGEELLKEARERLINHAEMVVNF